MYRGTTPTVIFTIPYTADMIEGGYITFAQRGLTVLEKKIGEESVVVNDNAIKIYLTQEETLNMTSVAKLKVQIRLKLTGGGAVASQIMEGHIGDILKGGVI